MYDLEGIRQKISLVALAEEAGAHFDTHLRSPCPLPQHAGDRSSKSFCIYEQGTRWKCFSSCPHNANGGDVIAFYMAWKGVDFKTALAELAARVGIEPGNARAPAIPAVSRSPPPIVPPLSAWRERARRFVAWAEANLAAHPGAQEYLQKERGLSPETIQAFHLGYNPANLYDDPIRWGLEGKKIWLPRGIVIPGFWHAEPWYIKIRRPLPGQALEKYLGAWSAQDGLADVKFGGPRGGKACLFRLEMADRMPVLLLTEGEWDTMLVWEYAPDLCDVATLGGANARFDLLDLALLTQYPVVVAVYDDDAAGERGREYLADLQKQVSRIHIARPPAHDLTDF